MKLIKLFVAIFAFCGYLGANETVIAYQEEPNLNPEINFTKPCLQEGIDFFGPIDFHQLFKNHFLGISEVEDGPVLTEVFDDPMIQSYINNLKGCKRKAAIKRLYTASIALEIIFDPEVDLEADSIENYRLFLENEYSISLPKYTCLELNNENRISYAYVLTMANGLAILEDVIDFDAFEVPVGDFIISSNHSKRMLHTAISIFPYFALEEATKLFVGNEVTQNQIENISIDFFENRISFNRLADRITDLFK